MSKIALRLFIAVTTFTLGVVATAYWLVPRFRKQFDPTAAAPAIYLQAAEQPKTVRCPADRKPELKNSRSIILSGENVPWKAADYQVGGGEDLGVVQFLNANDGWAGGADGALYKTADAGKTWQKLKLNVPPTASVNSLSFVTPSVGWVVTSERGDEFRDINSVRSLVLGTTDGGKSWQEQYAEKASVVYRVRFLNEQEGWAVGAKLPVCCQYVGIILRTTDGGRHWTDISPKPGEDEIGNTSAVVNIIPTGPSKAVILKFSRIFYSTDDGGRTWNRAAVLAEEPPQSLSDELTLSGNNQLWAVGGADSIEGMWGTVARMDSDCSWARYTVGGVFFYSGVFLSDNQAFVSGSIPSLGQGKSFESRSRDGLILYSSDGAATWVTVYRNAKAGMVSSLAVADARNVWAVGKSGFIIHLTPITGK